MMPQINILLSSKLLTWSWEKRNFLIFFFCHQFVKIRMIYFLFMRKLSSINRIKGENIQAKHYSNYSCEWVMFQLRLIVRRETSTSSFNLMIMRVHSSTLSIRQHISTLSRWELEMSIISFLLHCIAYYEEKSSLEIYENKNDIRVWKGKKNDWDFTWTTFSISP